MSIWTAPSDILSGVVQIGTKLQELWTFLTVDMVNYIFKVFLSLVLALYYPVGLMIWFVQTVWCLGYYTFAVYFNSLIGLFNIPINLINFMAGIPTEWLSLFYISLAISLLVRGYRWVREVRGWIPFIWGGGD